MAVLELPYIFGTQPGRKPVWTFLIEIGAFEGPLLRGAVCHGCADWNTAVSPQLSHAFAKYWLKTDDGVYISVENEGYLDHTNPTAVIKTTPKFQCDINSPYGFLCKGVYAGELTGGSNNSVDITIYLLK